MRDKLGRGGMAPCGIGIDSLRSPVFLILRKRWRRVRRTLPARSRGLE